jgi:uncharacterized protein with GYD domain
MPKYLVQASYTGEGLKGLQKDKASGRKEAAKQAVEGLGGRLECIYFAFGEDDVVAIIELPDNVAAARLAIAVGASGLIRTRTTPLLTVEEVDQALGAPDIGFRAPGQSSSGGGTSLDPHDDPHSRAYAESMA